MIRKPVDPPVQTIKVLPLGPDQEEDVFGIIAANLQGQLSLPVDILPPSPLPESAYDPLRDQYNALDILRHMKSLDTWGNSKVLGVVTVDLFIPILTYVLGEAQLGNACAVISLKRIRILKNGDMAPLSLYFQRAAKLAVHELLHTFNLMHCKENTCILNYLGDLDSLDARELVMCRYCESVLAEEIGRMGSPSPEVSGGGADISS